MAIAQLLIDALRDCDETSIVGPPFGPPSAANVLLKDDGTVICCQCGTTPAIFEVAILLQSLLPPTSSRVAGGLRYTIARALLEVDVQPFDLGRGLLAIAGPLRAGAARRSGARGAAAVRGLSPAR